MKHKKGRTQRTTSKMPGINRIPRTVRAEEARNRALHALARVRRGESLSKAAKSGHTKPSTVLKHLSNQFHRDGPGKQWSATKSDRLSARMNIVTPQGPITALVRGSRQRTILAEYNIALRKWRENRPGAQAELAKFEGKRVAGHVLITDTKLLATLEDAGLLGFDELYSSLTGAE